MDNLHRQGSWSGSSLSVPFIRSAQSIGLPFAAHFASSTRTTSSGAATTAATTTSSTTSTLGISPNPELEEVFARMRRHLENGKWEPEDSQALLSLLDEGNCRCLDNRQLLTFQISISTHISFIFNGHM